MKPAKSRGFFRSSEDSHGGGESPLPFFEVKGALSVQPAVFEYEEEDSTNARARVLLTQGCIPYRGLIRAKKQYQGRGRKGRRWCSPVGGLWMTYVLRPSVSHSRWGLYPLLAGVAVHQAICETCQIQIDLKWPNDLLWRRRKLGGILCEGVYPHVLIGIGINGRIHWASEEHEQMRQEPIDLYTATDGAFDASDSRLGGLALAIGKAIEEWDEMLTHSAAAVRKTWSRLSSTLGQTVIIQQGRAQWEGVARALDDEGALLVEKSDGAMTPVRAGDVSLRLTEREI